MPEQAPIQDPFIRKLTETVEKHLSEERFGVSELASAVGMSRSNLLRRVSKATGLSASQFIRQVRLSRAMEFLQQSAGNVSEIAFQVGFSSTSYFIKCFREEYGYPPGEVAQQSSVTYDQTGRSDTSEREVQRGDSLGSKMESEGKRFTWKTRDLLLTGSVILLTAVIVLLYLRTSRSGKLAEQREKSIAVLPFKNDSNDSTNVYIINGLMESILDNLQKIEDLRVLSRTSVEKYRHVNRTIPEIAGELQVSYLLEGSGQKIGDQIVLNVQLIDASTDSHLWAEQYNRETGDIFDLQNEVAFQIAREIEVIITPEEEERIRTPPTENLVAYDLFLKGLDHFYSGTREGLEKSIPFFKRAIDYDPGFARAYADIALAYVFMDIYQVEQRYSAEISEYAEKAYEADPRLVQSLIAKAMVHVLRREYREAVPYLEEALEYHPNSALVINILSDFYTSYIPDSKKYLEYALKGIRLDIASHDSAEVSFIYLHISSAFMQSGFVEEAETYIQKSLDYDPENIFSMYLNAYIIYARNMDLRETRQILLDVLERDPGRYDVLQEVGKVCYYMRDFDQAFIYYRRYLDVVESQNLDVYRGEKAKIGLVMERTGHTELADSLFGAYRQYAENDQSLYKHLSLAMYHSYQGDTKKALDELEIFSREKNFHYWIILFLEMDPLVDSIRDLPEFQRILSRIKFNFWEYHQQIKENLAGENLI